jgi:hypothetical protein
MLPPLPVEPVRLRFPRTLVFMANFCMMLIQVVSGRLIAPYLGYVVKYLNLLVR